MGKDILYTKQFDVYEAELSDMGIGIVPCVIVQNNVGNKFSTTTIIAPLVSEKKEKGCLYFKIKLKNLGEMYVFVSSVRAISKSRLTNKSPIDSIDDANTKARLSMFLLANMGVKSVLIDGKRKIVDLSDEELDSFYKESEEC